MHAIAWDSANHMVPRMELHGSLMTGMLIDDFFHVLFFHFIRVFWVTFVISASFSEPKLALFILIFAHTSAGKAKK